MKKFEVTFFYGGYKFSHLIGADSIKAAKRYLEKSNDVEYSEYSHVKYTEVETAEEPNIIVPRNFVPQPPFWMREGASSSEEYLAYTGYCQKLEDEATRKYYAKYGELPDGFDMAEFNYQEPTFREWRAGGSPE
ncbi:MAG: hypothetical protein IIU04_06385 [Bacteroidales bacterium]|nr:hypothetical protein [Bacteroidales bacterium]